MADYDLALGIKPPQIDVATPLLTAAKIRAADLAEQKHAIEMQFLPAFQQAQLRNLGLTAQKTQQDIEEGPLRLKAELDAKDVSTQAARHELRSGQIGQILQGVAPFADQPDFQDRMKAAHKEMRDRGLITPQEHDRLTSQPIGILDFQAELGRTRNAAQTLAERKQTFDEMKPIDIGSDISGEIKAVRNTKTGQYHRIDVRTGQVSPTPLSPQPPTVTPAPETPITPGATPAATVTTPTVPAGAPSAQQAQAPSPTAPRFSPEAHAAGQKYLDENIPKDWHDLVKGTADYELDPANSSIKNNQRQRFLNAVTAYAKARGENFDQTFYPTKKKTLADFSSGVEGRVTRAVGNLTEHLDVAEEAIKALENGGPQAWNAIKNKVKAQFGFSEPTNLAAMAPIISGEMVKVIAGAQGGSMTERLEAQAGALGQAQTTKQALDGLRQIKKLMVGQVHGLENQYKVGTRLDNFRERLTPAARKVLESAEAANAAPPGSNGTASGKTKSGVPWSVE